MEEIFEEKLNQRYELVKQIVFSSVIPDDYPKVVYIVGQTGSGKTGMIQKILENDCNVVVIDNDTWRKYYPGYKEIVQKQGTDEVQEITREMKRWREKILDTAIEGKYSLIVHTSMTAKEETEQQIEKFKKNGYNIEIVFLGINERESRLGMCIRYLTALANGRVCRYPEDHDKVYRELPYIVELVIRNQELSDISVCFRDITSSVWETTGQEQFVEEKERYITKKIENPLEEGRISSEIREIRNRKWSERKNRQFEELYLRTMDKLIELRKQGAISTEKFEFIIQEMEKIKKYIFFIKGIGKTIE